MRSDAGLRIWGNLNINRLRAADALVCDAQRKNWWGISCTHNTQYENMNEKSLNRKSLYFTQKFIAVQREKAITSTCAFQYFFWILCTVDNRFALSFSRHQNQNIFIKTPPNSQNAQQFRKKNVKFVVRFSPLNNAHLQCITIYNVHYLNGILTYNARKKKNTQIIHHKLRYFQSVLPQLAFFFFFFLKFRLFCAKYAEKMFRVNISNEMKCTTNTWRESVCVTNLYER